MELIDKGALLAEIRGRLLPTVVPHGTHYDDWDRGADNERLNILSFINTLEVKEVDFETAFAASIDHFDEKNNYGQWPESDLKDFAKHFFELGLKAQKGE